jgi:hypothetical protein
MVATAVALFVANIAILTLEFYSVIHLTGFAQLVYSRIDLNGQANLGSFFSFLLWTACSFLCFFVGVRKDLPFHKHWQVLAIVFLLPAIDELVGAHQVISEFMRHTFSTQSVIFHKLGWAIPAAILAALAVVAFYRFWVSLPPATRFPMLLGLAVFAFGAVAVELISIRLGSFCSYNCWSYEVSSNVEEGMQLLGQMILVHGLLSYITSLESPPLGVRIGQ